LILADQKPRAAAWRFGHIGAALAQEQVAAEVSPARKIRCARPRRWSAYPLFVPPAVSRAAFSSAARFAGRASIPPRGHPARAVVRQQHAGAAAPGGRRIRLFRPRVPPAFSAARFSAALDPAPRPAVAG
jgi:hypothetical protein